MEKRNRRIVGIGIGLFVLGLCGVFGGDVVREAWAQARTVLYKDFQQTITVPHIFNTTVAGPPFSVAGSSLGVPAPGLAPDLLGQSTVAGLPSATLGKMRILSDGGAIGAPVVGNGTTWDCSEAKARKIHIVTCPPYNAIPDDSISDSAAFTAAIGAGGRTVVIPPGTFLLSNVYFKTGTRIIGAGMGITILKLPDGSLGSVLVNPETPALFDVEIAYLTIDGNAANQVSPNVAAFGSNGVTRFWFHHLHVKNSIEYCIGLEHGTHVGKISDVIIENCRWDGIDIKNANNDTRVEIVNVYVHGPGTTFGIYAGQALAACFDQGGVVKLSNVRCTGLTGDRYGFGFRRHQTGPASNCNLAFCQGGEGSSLTNFYISGDGTTTALGAGIRVRDDYVQISNGYITGTGNGVWIESDDIGSADHVTVTNVQVTNGLGSGVRTNDKSNFASFVNVVVTTVAEYGAVFGGTSERFIGGSIRLATFDGILVTATAHNVKIIGNNISSNTLRGISFADGADNAIIANNTIVANGLWGVSTLAGCNNTIIEGNNILSNTSGGITDGGTNTKIQNNVGVVTANRGQGTIASGATSAVIAHGLDFTPTAQEIAVTLLENPTNDVGLVYVDTVTATNFTVRVRADPGASNADFGWRVVTKQ